MNDQAQRLRELVAQKSQKKRKFITIASGKGGVGKTNFALNFSYIMANVFKKKVLLIDADIGMANIHLFLQTDAKKNLKRLFYGEPVEEIIQKAFGFDVLLGFSGIDEFEEIDGLSVQSIINDLERISQKYEYVVIDTGAGVDEKVVNFLRASQRSFIVTTPEPTALMDAYALIRTLYNLYGYTNFSVVVNMCRNKEEGRNTFAKLKMTVFKFLGLEIDLLGMLPYTNTLRRCVREKRLITMHYPKDSYSINMKKICQEEARVEIAENPRFWQKLFDLMGK